MYQARLSNYEGPLDLLLQLIEQSKLDVTEIALAQVTQQYLSYVETLVTIDAEELGRFTEVAARLIHVKSLALLPGRTETADSESAELASQLSEYRKYQQAAEALRTKLAAPERGFERPAVKQTPAPPEIGSINSAQLQAAFQAAIDKLEPAADTGTVEAVLSFEEVLDSVSLACRRTERTKLSDLIASANTRLEIVMLFLALLELARLRQVSICQDEAFGDIMVTNEPEP